MHSPTKNPFCLLLFALVWALGPGAQASSKADFYTLELPIEANVATPVWLGHPETPAGSFASLDLPLTVPDSGDSLLITIFFQEKDGGFLRLSWKNAAGEQVLSSNFYEGVSGMSNQRSLLVPSSVMAGGGTLILQCGDPVLDVQKIHFEWLENQAALVSPEQADLQVISGLGKRSDATWLDGQPAGSASPSLDGSLVTVPLVNAPQRIEQGVEFNLQLDGVPHAARISFSGSISSGPVPSLPVCRICGTPDLPPPQRSRTSAGGRVRFICRLLF
jgi:hypothetical protein